MHVTKVRVRYAETDQAGVVYHSNFLHWFEVGRTELLRDLGHPYSAIERDQGVLLTVVEARLQYHRPALYDDLLRIETRIGEIRRVRMQILTRIVRDGTGESLCSGHVWLASVGRDGSPVPIPEGLATALAKSTDSQGKTDPSTIV